MLKIMTLAVLPFVAITFIPQSGENARQEPAFEAEAGKLLADPAQAWWNKHRLAPSAKAVSYTMAPNDPGGRPDPPPYTAMMPVEVAAWLHSGGRPPADHPLQGRRLVLLDVRRRSEWLAERIPGSVNVPGRDLEASLENGDLSKLDRSSLLVVFGSKWPHFDVISKIRPRGFEALYAMEGLESWKAKGAKVERDEKLVQFLKETEGERIASAPVPLPPEPEPLPGMDAKALKKLLDAGVDLLCVFAGDRKTYEDGHVPGAHHVPVASMEKWFADVDKNQLIVVMCGCCMGRNGGMSEAGFKKLEELGFKRVMHLDGHMNGWKVAGLPVQTEDPPPRKPKK